MEHDVYADDITRVQTGSGGLLASFERIPLPWVHAAAPGDDQTVCKRPTAGLHHFAGLAFEDRSYDLQCPDCRETLNN